MANECYCRMIVKGRKEDCYAFMEKQPHYMQEVDSEEGTDEKYEIRFHGSCAWGVNSADVIDGSEMYNVDVVYNSFDECACQYEDYKYGHYKNGKPIDSYMYGFLDLATDEEITDDEYHYLDFLEYYDEFLDEEYDDSDEEEYDDFDDDDNEE